VLNINRLATTTTIITKTTTTIKSKTTTKKTKTTTRTTKRTTSTTTLKKKIKTPPLECEWAVDDLDFLIPLGPSDDEAATNNRKVLQEETTNVILNSDDDDHTLFIDNNKRSRAFSFECFSFGKNADDEPLPPPIAIEREDYQHQPEPVSSSPTADDAGVEHDPQPDRVPSSSSSPLGGGGDMMITKETNENNPSYVSDNDQNTSGGDDDQLKLRGMSIDLAFSSDEMEIMDALFCPQITKSSSDDPTTNQFIGDVYPPISIPSTDNDPRSSVASPSTVSLPEPSPSSSMLSADDDDDSSSTLDVLHTTFQMNLLNKGGRVGMYLPEARKKRIAKFLEKRKKRIWHKKTRYKCRKKLAHGRVRVKGRFVKSPPENKKQQLQPKIK